MYPSNQPLSWRKSTHSSGGTGDCVEVAPLTKRGDVAVRDSKNPDGGVLTFASGDWQAFLGRIKGGDLV